MKEAIYRYGYGIYTVMKQNDYYVPYQTIEGKIAPKKYYYYDHNLTVAEIRMLKDALETYSYFSVEDITEIITKLMRLRPKSFSKQKYFDIAGDAREEDSLFLMNIDMLNEIIRHRNCAEITYCYYNEKKKLVVRPGYPKIVEPINLMWSNGYYYLLAYNEKYQNIVNMRVDRITNIKEIEIENTHRVDSFNPVQYRHEHPVMYGGKKTKIILLCKDTGKNYIMNTIMDVFGKNAKVTLASAEIIEEQLGNSLEYYKEHGVMWLKVVIESMVGGVELWATQYCDDCIVVSPEDLAERVKERLTNGLKNYKI